MAASKGHEGAPPFGASSPTPTYPTLEENGINEPVLSNFSLAFSPYRNTFSPSMPPPKFGVATGCHWSPWLPAQSLCVVSCSVTKCYQDPPSLAFSNPCFPVFLVYNLNSLHKIMSNIVFSEVASAFKSRVGQQPTRKTKMRGKNEEKFEEKNEKLRENEERLRKCSDLANLAHPGVRGWLRPWSFSRLSGY